MDEQKIYLQNAFQQLGVTLSELQTGQFLQYASLLCEWNEKINLTSITEFEGIVQKHFVDSCALALFPEYSGTLRQARLIDVGTGAGFPGVPLKILFPELKLTLLDSLQKRIRFLEVLTAELGLKDVRLVHARAEDAAASPEHREQYEICVSRAVAKLSVLAEYDLPFLKPGGTLFAYKSADIGAEAAEAAKAIGILGGKAEAPKLFTLPGTDLGRSLVIIRKINGTPKRFPRKAGTASREPIC